MSLYNSSKEGGKDMKRNNNFYRKENLEIGMYVRTKKDGIGVITNLWDEAVGFHTNKSWRQNYSQIVDASYELKKLIRPGDYINGILISSVENGIFYPDTQYRDVIYLRGITLKNIYNILTKEQYALNCFTISELFKEDEI